MDFCPDAQSPELSVPCPTHPAFPGSGGASTPDIDLLPWTGALLFLLIGIAVGAVVAGLVLLYWRRRDAQVNDG